jgi:hypothetical protein
MVMSKYRVYRDVTTEYFIDVVASSVDEALQITEGMSNEHFTLFFETNPFVSAEEIE